MLKKIMLSILGLIFISTAFAENKITLYYLDTCPHCHHAKNFLENKLLQEYPDLELTQVLVKGEKAQKEFLKTVGKCKFNSYGVPVMLVNNKCLQGFGNEDEEKIRSLLTKPEIKIVEKKVVQNESLSEPEEVKKKNEEINSQDKLYIFFGFLFLSGLIIFVSRRKKKTSE